MYSIVMWAWDDWQITFSCEPLQHAQDDMQRLNKVLRMLLCLELEYKLLHQASQHWQQAALLLVIMQQPAATALYYFPLVICHTLRQPRD